MIRRPSLVFPLAFALAACSGPAQDDPVDTQSEEEEVAEVDPKDQDEQDVEETDPEPDEETDTEEMEPVEVPMPEVLGVGALEDLNPDPDVVEVEITARVQDVELGEGLTLEMYTYNGTVPGPLLQAEVGDKVVVHFKNELPEPTTIHWHGLRIPDEMDGNPRIQDPVETGGTFTYEFVVPDEGTYWYHPHVRSNVQIEKGLAAPMIVRERAEERPEVDRERYFVLDDILLDGDEYYPFLANHMEFMHGRWGNLLMTNGFVDLKAATVQKGEVERWRFVNTANARTMEVGITGATFRIVGTDGGRVEPYTRDRLVLPVGRRYDVEVVYDSDGPVKLQQYILERDAEGNVVEDPYDLMIISVNGETEEPTQVDWPAATPLPEREVDREDTVVLDAVEGASGIEWRLNGESHAMEPLFTWNEGETVRLKLQNELGPEHPFHLHGQFFQIPGEPGLRDTVLVPGVSTVEVIAYMDNPGQWMMHCHINEHSELGMMGEFIVRDTE